MGLPGFFSWILKESHNNILLHTLQNVKYLYIDANCIIHTECAKVLEQYPTLNQESLELHMFMNICKFMDYLETYKQMETSINELINTGI